MIPEKERSVSLLLVIIKCCFQMVLRSLRTAQFSSSKHHADVLMSIRGEAKKESLENARMYQQANMSKGEITV